MAAQKMKIVAFTGSGVSSPSGLATFRDPDGIWARYRVEEVATPEAWLSNPGKVLEFYNLRRAQLGEVRPNQAHLTLAALEDEFEVVIITQNVDDLHERGGSSRIIHLHGELTKVKSEKAPVDIIDVGYREVRLGDTDRHGTQLRPNVVWFGESVENLDIAADEFATADIVVIAGTSLAVYPAASLIHYAPAEAARYIIDPNDQITPKGYTHLQGSADREMIKLEKLIRDRPKEFGRQEP